MANAVMILQNTANKMWITKYVRINSLLFMELIIKIIALIQISSFFDSKYSNFSGIKVRKKF